MALPYYLCKHVEDDVGNWKDNSLPRKTHALDDAHCAFLCIHKWMAKLVGAAVTLQTTQITVRGVI